MAIKVYKGCILGVYWVYYVGFTYFHTGEQAKALE